MKSSGFTVVELLVSIAIMAIVLGIGVPSFNELIRNSAIRSNSNDIVVALNYARMEAVKRGDNIILSQRIVTAPTSWSGGVVVWVDTDGDDTLDAGEELRLWDAFSNGSQINSTNTSIVFSALGEASPGDVFTLCDDRTGETGRTITILVSGAVYVEEKNDCT
ncbi:GspH/FimT family pseudopilin [Psychromonas sp. PT13]|uniref:GspH/FimT family pseudopilin n=1 Tax=Psychromonas sp. PT13 TaxID=3439547 RepID=UPI003EBB863E